MENTNLKIECHKLNDDGSMVYQPMSNLDGLIWNGVYIIRSFNDNGSWGLPFTLADNEAVNLVVKDQAHRREDATDAQRTVVQTVTRVEKETGEVLTYSRTRRNVNGTQVWSEWSYLTAESTSDIKPNSVSTEKLAPELREKINNPLRPLFIAAGAEYNDIGTDKTKTAPWGETVTHKAGHYYLNGLGDITEEQMMDIYTRGLFNENDVAPLAYSGFNNIRTNLGRAGSYNTSISTTFVTFNNTAIEVCVLSLRRQTGGNMTFTGTSLFLGSSKLRVIDVNASIILKNSNVAIFERCYALEEVRLKELAVNLFLGDSSQISKQTIKYAIANANPSSAISVTLHPDAYARLADDADIVAALEAQPLVSLVSA